MKWASTLLSLAIIAAFGAFYVFHYLETVRQTEARDRRLLAAAGEALHQATGGTAERASISFDTAACPRGIGVKIYVSAPPKPESKVAEVNKTGAETNASQYCVTFKQILAFVPRATQVFENILLIKQDEKILAQSQEFGVHAVPALHALRGMSADGKQATDKPIKLSDVGLTTAVHLGDGKSLRLFCQPTPAIEVDAASGPSRAESLYLCGLVSDEALQRSSLWVSPLFVISLCLLLTFTLLIPPFVKVKLLSYTERFRFSDAFALALCTALGLMLLTLFCHGFASYVRLADFADKELAAVSDELTRNLGRELSAAGEQLDAFSKKLSSEKGSQPRALTAADLEKYAGVESLAWADTTGQQQIKLSALRIEDQRLLSVAERDYFKRALVAKKGEVTLDSVRTWSAGSPRAILATKTAPPSSEGVAILSAELRSLTRPALPDGISFCVVNRAGKVLFHSEPSLGQSHNLVTESDDDADLRELIETRGTGVLATISYFGKTSRAYVRPFVYRAEPTDLSIVVLEDVERLRTVVVKGILPAIRYCIGYLGIWLGLTALYVLLWSKTIPWFWPNRNWKASYVAVAVVFAVLGLLALFLTHLLKNECVIFFLPIGLALAGYLVLSLARRVRLSKRRRLSDALWERTERQYAIVKESSYWSCYRVAAALFWFVCAVVPTYAFGRLTMDRAATEFSRTRELSFAAVSAERGLVPKASTDAANHYAAIGAYRIPLNLDASDAKTVLQQKVLEVLRFRPGDLSRHQAATLIALLFFVIAISGLIAVVGWAERHILLWGIEAPERRPWEELGASSDRFIWCVTALPPATRLGDASRLCIELFDRGPAPLRSALSMLEARLGADQPSVVVSDRGPHDFIAELLLDPELPSELPERFRGLSSSFRVVHLASAPTNQAELDAFVSDLSREALPDRAWLDHELRSNRAIFEGCRAALPRGSFDGVERLERRRRLRDAAWSTYHELWTRCSKLEKLTLAQLAAEGFVNEKRREVVRSLLARGIMTRRPMLAPFNDGFESFVEQAGAELGVAHWEARPEGFSWAELRAPIATLFACSAGVLFLTDRNLIDSTLVFATTLTGVLPNLGRLAAAVGLGAQRVATSSAAAGVSSGVS